MWQENSFFNSNLFVALVALVVGVLAYYVYWKQRRDNKRDVAKIILQEIRRAEDIISDYKQNGGYQFDKNIIATNSWSKNLHLFVGDLDNDEIDRISNLYSTGGYLDTLIKEISEYTFKNEIGYTESPIVMPVIPQNVQQQSQTVAPEVVPNIPSKIRFVKLEPPWKGRLDLITLKLEPIYHSTIAEKLKRIAKLK